MSWSPTDEDDIESEILKMYSDSYLTFEEYDQITTDDTVNIGIADDAYCIPEQYSSKQTSNNNDELYLAAMVSDLKPKMPGQLTTTFDILDGPQKQYSIENEITSMLRCCGKNSYKTPTLQSNKAKNQIKENDFIISNGLPILLNSDYFELKHRQGSSHNERSLVNESNKTLKPKHSTSEVNQNLENKSKNYITPREVYLNKRDKH